MASLPERCAGATPSCRSPPISRSCAAASHPDELVLTAAALGHRAIAVTDRNSLAGIVRAHQAAKEAGIRLVVGCRLDLARRHEPARLSRGSRRLWPADAAADPRQAPRAQGRMPSRLRRCGRARRGPDRRRPAPGGAATPPPLPPASPPISPAAPISPRTTSIAATMRGASPASPASRAATGLPLVATNDVLYHAPERRPLQDVLTCIREHCTIREAGFRLAANAERHLKPPAEMARLFRGHEDALARSLEIAERCRFSLDELRYEYPEEPVPPGMTPQQRLAALTWEGAAERFGCASAGTSFETPAPQDEEMVEDGINVGPHPEGGPRPRLEGRTAPIQHSSSRPRVRDLDRARAGADRAARLRALFPHRPRHRALCRGAAASCARGAARRPIRRSAIASASPRSTRRGSTCCSSASSAPRATSRPTSTSISSTSGARR